MDVRGDISRDAIEDFLEDTRIPLRLACRTAGDRLWMLSLWYRYRDGTLECATAADADVVGYLDHHDRVAFEVSTNDQPYRGVRGRGRAMVAPDPEKDVLRDLLERYQGGTDTELGRRLLSDRRDEVAISIEPAVVYGWDFSDRMSAGRA